MRDLPNTLWIARREYVRFDGIETVESIVVFPEMVPEFAANGYEIREYVRSPNPDLDCEADTP